MVLCFAGGKLSNLDIYTCKHIVMDGVEGRLQEGVDSS